jgi:L-alanine-DL-glutamate epimerase-like enolase superfamily enzyme
MRFVSSAREGIRGGRRRRSEGRLIGHGSVIEEVRLGTLDLALRKTFRTHWKKLRDHATLHVRVRSGAVWGEGEAYTMDLDRGLGALRDLRLEGQEISDMVEALDAITDSAARSALDLAFHDLLGRLRGIPVWHLLGLPRATRTTCVSIGIDEPEAMLQDAREWIGRGFPILKVKITTGTDPELLHRIRALGGPSLRLWVDANQAFDPEGAVSFARTLAEVGVEVFEQPLAVGQIDRYAAIRSEIGIPIILDEEIHCPEDVARAAHVGGIDGINVKLAKMGGIRAGLHAIRVARARGLRVFLGCYFESSLGIAGAATLLAHADYVDLDSPLHLADDPYSGLDFRGAEIAPPDAPGLGVGGSMRRTPLRDGAG